MVKSHEQTAESSLPGKRRWLQFRLRTLLAIVTVLAVSLGIHLDWTREDRVAALLREQGGEVWTEPAGPRWLHRLAGRQYGVRIVKLYFRGPQITDDTLKPLSSLQYLNTLSLDRTKVTAAGLGRLNGLKVLQLSGPEVTDETMAPVKDFVQLRTLTLSETSVTNAGLKHLKGLINLERLGVGRSPQITNEGLEHLSGLTNLRELHLGGTSVSDTGLEHLKHLTELRTLNLCGTQLTGSGLEHLKGLRNLQDLELSMCPALTDANLAGLQHLTTLQKLTLALNPQLTGTFLVHIKGLTALETLVLRGTKVPVAALAYLKALPNLSHPDLSDLNLTGLEESDDPDK